MTNTTHPPILLTSIIDTRPTAERHKKEDAQSWSNFVNSIREVGVISAIVLEEVAAPGIGQHFCVVVGGRRLAACHELGYTELTHAKACVPGVPGYLLSDELTPDQRLEIELDENIQRLNIHWHEEVLQITRIHEARRKNAALDPDADKWGQRQTGALLNMSLGDVSNTLSVAAHIRSGDKEILAASNFPDAMRILLQRKKDEANAILVKRGLASVPSVNTLVPPNITTDSASATKRKTSDVLEFDLDGERAPSSRSSGEQDLGTAPGMDADGKITTIVPLSEMLHLGPMEEVVPKVFPDNFFDLGVCDIPYGIDMGNLDLKKLSRVDKQHDVQENVALMPHILKQYWRTLKDGSFLYLFYDQDHHKFLRDEAEKLGFKIQRWPLIWCKTHPCKNQSPQYNWTKSHETCYVMRKGNITLNKPQTTSWMLSDGQVEARMYDNPFAKPFDIWKWIYNASGVPGMKVADFCAGEGSSLRAAIMCGLMPYGVEISDLHFNPLVENIKKAYETLTRGKVEFK